MEIKPGDIVRTLELKDQELLNNILNVEKRMLHYSEIKSNSREERETVNEIVSLIDKVIEDVN